MCVHRLACKTEINSFEDTSYSNYQSIQPLSHRVFNYKLNYYISKLVHALWLVSLARHTLLQGPLKFYVFLLPNCCVIYHQIFLTYIASKSLKLSFTTNCVKKTCQCLKTISNWLVLLPTCFRNLKPFLMRGNRSRTRQTHNRGTTSSSRSVL